MGEAGFAMFITFRDLKLHFRLKRDIIRSHVDIVSTLQLLTWFLLRTRQGGLDTTWDNTRVLTTLLIRHGKGIVAEEGYRDVV